MRSGRQMRHHADKSFWTCYSDVIAGLLLVIILVFVASANLLQREARRMQERNSALLTESDRLKQETEELRGQSTRGECIRDHILTDLGAELRTRVQRDGGDASWVERTDDGLVLLFDDKVRFEVGAADLPIAEAKRLALKRILNARDAYYSIPEAPNVIDKVHIVGRTDLTGDTLLNTLLSIKRSTTILGLLSWVCPAPECGETDLRYTDSDPAGRFTSRLTVQGIGRQGARTRTRTESDGRTIETRDNPEFRRVELHFVAKSPLIINSDYHLRGKAAPIPLQCQISHRPSGGANGSLMAQ
jgi:hypothetical protein